MADVSNNQNVMHSAPNMNLLSNQLKNPTTEFANSYTKTSPSLLLEPSSNNPAVESSTADSLDSTTGKSSTFVIDIQDTDTPINKDQTCQLQLWIRAVASIIFALVVLMFFALVVYRYRTCFYKNAYKGLPTVNYLDTSIHTDV